MVRAHEQTIGNRLAPRRFLWFIVLLVAGAAAATDRLGWRAGLMLGFDGAAAVFLLSLYPLFGKDPHGMRRQSAANDANRAVLLAITGIVTAAILAAVAAELTGRGSPPAEGKALVIATLAVAWLFSNMVYALHYAHLYYLPNESGRGDHGGLDFPSEKEPGYWDFVYFALTLGMTFQTSDVTITRGRMRKVVLFHSLAAFVFNLGVVAFTINVLGSGG